MNTKLFVAGFTLALAGLTPAARAQTNYSENFTGPTTTNSWFFINGACMTAGTAAASTPANPACQGLAYYPSRGDNNVRGGDTGAMPDPTSGPAPIGGALRFTNSYGENGAILSNFNFPLSTSGLAVSFTTVTYEGDSGGGGHDGADGISFFLQDATVAPDVGAFGGSLGYTCSNQNNDQKLRPSGVNRGYDGLEGGYIGLGIDEYGNFLNQPDNTSSGDLNAAGTGEYQPGRIGMRGPGSTTWNWLNTNYPVQYPSALTNAQKSSAVQQACKTGLVWDWSQVAATGAGTSIAYMPTTVLSNYTAIPGAFSILPAAQPIANEAATIRSQATPITYNVKITKDGHLSFSYSYNGGANLNVISSLDITAGGTIPIPANVRFGFAGSTGGSTNIHEIMCFQATPTNTSQSSAGINQKQTAKVQIGTQVYFAFYNPATLAGSLTSQYLDQSVANPNLLSIDSNITWDASCVLTGAAAGQCDAPNGPPGAIPVQSYTNRNIFTWNGVTGQGIPFEWTNLSAFEQPALDSGDATAATPPPFNYSRLNYLRGFRGDEQTPSLTSPTAFNGVFRDRTSVLGDIIDSSPTWVGPPSGPYPATWNDALHAAGDPLNENSGTTYATFASSAVGGFQTRTNVVYAGANDGLLHGFRSGKYDNTNTYVPATNDGTEVLAYMPRHIVRSIQSASGVPPVYNSTLNFSDPQYGHKFDVDAPPGTGDLFYNGTWHTWLIGGLGPGGSAIYALDITDPDNTFTESAANALTVVKGEWSSSTINCVNTPTPLPGGCATDLGNTFGVPQIRRFHNGSWGAVFGNGFGSATGDAGIFVMLVDPASAAITFYYLSTGNAGANGIAYTTPADLDGDHIVDYVYAGDLLGNVWRFDLTSTNPANWAVTPNALYTTPAGQPITTKLAVASVAGTGNPRVLIEFGTGQQTPMTNFTSAQYSTSMQALYGIWDWNMLAWNSMSTAQYASLPNGAFTAPGLPPAPAAAITGTSQLLQQTITSTTTATQANTGSDYRTVSNAAVCWADTTGCPTGQFGWYLPLVSGNANPTDPAVPQNGNPTYAGNPVVYEQIIFSPVLEAGAFIINTTIPPASSPVMCLSTSASGYTMALNPATGGAFTNSFFSFFDSTGKLNFLNVNAAGNVPVSGIALGGTGSASIVQSGTQSYLITQTVSGVGAIEAVNPPGGTKGSRLTWIQRR